MEKVTLDLRSAEQVNEVNRPGGPHTPIIEKFFWERAGVPENASFLGWDGIPRLCGVLSLWLINCFSRVLARLSIR
jgi:hypothetical protein